MSWGETFRNDPVIYLLLGLLFLVLWIFLPPHADLAALACLGILSVMAVKTFKNSQGAWSGWYERLLENYLPFTVLTLIAVAAGGAIQIIPAVVVNRAQNVEDRIQVPYTPLELAGRDLFVAEGCYNCHSQMIRMMVPDVLRYGRPGVLDDYSRLGESIYDFPFQWGSKRTGPDLAREGGKRPNVWHWDHLIDPRSVVDGSIMPPYPWLAEQETDYKSLPGKIAVQQKYLKVPYPAMTSHEIEQSAREQAMGIAEDLKKSGRFVNPDAKLIALIAYLQKLGTYEEVEAVQPPAVEAGLPARGFHVPDHNRPVRGGSE